MLLVGGVDEDCVPLCDSGAVDEGGALRVALKEPQREAEEKALAHALLECAGEREAAVSEPPGVVERVSVASAEALPLWERASERDA